MNPAIAARLAALEAQVAYRRPPTEGVAPADPAEVRRHYHALVDGAPSDPALAELSPDQLIQAFRRLVGARRFRA